MKDKELMPNKKELFKRELFRQFEEGDEETRKKMIKEGLVEEVKK